MDKYNIDSVFDAKRKTFKEWFLEHQLGIYVTVIVHLIVFLFLTISSINTQLRKQTILIDFIHQAEPEKTPEELEAEEIARLEEELMALLEQQDNRPAISLPNIVVNAGASGEGEGGGGNYGGSQRSLGTFTDKAKQEKQDDKKDDKAIEGNDEDASAYREEKQAQGENYKGPSVVSYLLEGRMALRMPVPAYKCRGGGNVVVLITVNKLGYVTAAEVDKKQSSSDACVQEAACEAAMLAKFTVSPTGAISQKGNIVYRFVPQ